MAKSIPALVEPTMLRWARVPIDLPAIAASRKLDLPDDRVAAWEAGDERPTVAQLRKGRPALPPLTRCVLPARAAAGLRHTPRPRRHEGAAARPWSPALYADYRRAHEQREHVLDLAEADDIEPPAS